LNRINGWIFDVYADEQGMAVWVIDSEGVARQLRDALAPSFFVFGSHADLHAVCVMLSTARLPVRLRRAERHDLFLRRDLTLLEVQVLRPLLFASIFARVRAFRPALDLLQRRSLARPVLLFREGPVSPGLLRDSG
jgi:hypothetical protein